MLNIPRFIKKIFKSDNDKELDRLKSLVVQINHNEDTVKLDNLDVKPSKGQCEIIVYSSNHDDSLSNLPIEVFGM